MTSLPFFQCMGKLGDHFGFFEHGGLVDDCLDPYANAAFIPDTCGYLHRYRYLEPPWPNGCSGPQQAATRPLVFRSQGWEREHSFGFSATELASRLRSHGPLKICGGPHCVALVGYCCVACPVTTLVA